MVSIWQQQVLFQSLDFIQSLLLIYHPNCWQLLSVKWGQACNILQWNHIYYRIIFGQRMLQFTKYKIQNSAHLSKNPMWWVPIVSALCCSQKARNCLESGFWYFTQTCMEQTWLTTVLRKFWSQGCALLTVFSMHHCEPSLSGLGMTLFS